MANISYWLLGHSLSVPAIYIYQLHDKMSSQLYIHHTDYKSKQITDIHTDNLYVIDL